jgi:hypothetical protein
LPRTDLPLFFFGTLCDHDVLELVTDRSVPPSALTPAVLPGHSVVRYPGSSYPMLVQADDRQAQGRLFRDFAHDDLARILFFESDEYELRECLVVEPGRKPTPALLFAEARQVTATMEPWDLGTWQSTDKRDFLILAAEFMAWFGYGTIADAEAAWEEAVGRLSAAQATPRVAVT